MAKLENRIRDPIGGRTSHLYMEEPLLQKVMDSHGDVSGSVLSIHRRDCRIQATPSAAASTASHAAFHALCQSRRKGGETSRQDRTERHATHGC